MDFHNLPSMQELNAALLSSRTFAKDQSIASSRDDMNHIFMTINVNQFKSEIWKEIFFGQVFLATENK